MLIDHQAIQIEMIQPREERIFWQEKFFGDTFDFKSRTWFWRFDGCAFVDCTILIDAATEQLAFTECTFKDCNIDHIAAFETRGLIVRGNFFARPLNERKADFDRRLAETLNARKLSRT